MVNFIEELKEEGIEIGIEQGIVLGREQEQKISIYKAHLAGCDIELLMRIFPLSAVEILQIIEEMKNMEQAKGNN